MYGIATISKSLAAHQQVGSVNTAQCAPQRSLFNIVWFCLSTVLLCAWISVHPNTYQGNKGRALWRRLRLMVWTIIAPELILAWAVRQWCGAWTIRDKYTDPNTPEGRFDKGKQWFRDRNVKKEYQSREGPTREWTMSHGHLLAMGGFTLVHDPASINPHCTVLTDEIFEKHLKDNQIDFPSVTVPEIVDKSKRDFVAKTIAVFQSTWFIVQCIARGVQGLSLTQLELATLALASLNAVTSIFWLRKPLGLQEPVKVNLKRSEKAKSETSASESKSPQKLDVDKYLEFSKISEVAWNVFHAIAKGIRDIFQRSCENHPFIFVFQWCLFLPTYILALAFCLPFTFFPFAIVLSLRIVEPFVVLTTMPPHDNHGFLITRIVQYFHEIRFRFTTSISLNFDDWVNKIRSHNHTPFLPIPFFGTPSFIPLHRIFFAWFFILPALFFTLLFLSLLLLAPVLLFLCVLFIFNAAFGILATSRVNEDSTHVPAFYAPDTREGRYSRIVVFALFGVVFGGIHLVGWNFKFPTVIEQHLWRSTSLTITVIPLIVASIDFILVFRQKKMAPFATVVLLALELIMTLLLFVYVIARLALIAQALALLRRQPADAYSVVDWGQFVPHFG